MLDSNVANKCREAIDTCHSLGILEHSIQKHWHSEVAFDIVQFKRDAVLSTEMHKRIHVKLGNMSRGWLAKICQRGVSNKAVSSLYEYMELDDLFETHVPDMKKRADLLEAILWELHFHQSSDSSDLSEAASAIASSAFNEILDALINIGQELLEQSAQFDTSIRVTSLDEASRWLMHFESPFDEPDYTHSSLYGQKDWSTNTGRFCIPDTPDEQHHLRRVLALFYKLGAPRCFVEMSTPIHPLIEDIDILGSENAESPPDHLLTWSFWRRRAEILHSLFPGHAQLELTLFCASGWSTEHEKYKTSYHAVWNDILVDRPRAAAVRLATLAAFQKLKEFNWLFDEICEMDSRNSLEAMFDITAVRAGSFRMPFNDKVARGFNKQKEGRPLLPYGVLVFDAPHKGREPYSWMKYEPDGLSEIAWIERASVRRLDPDIQLTTFVPLRQSFIPSPPKWNADGSQCSTSLSSSGGGWRKKIQKEKQRWENEQRDRRRYWKGTAVEFKEQIDWYLGDEGGLQSTLFQIQARSGKTRWLWSTKTLKGAVEVQEPDGEVFVRGNLEQQSFLIELVKQFTREWKWDIPKFTKKPQARTKSYRNQTSYRNQRPDESVCGAPASFYIGDDDEEPPPPPPPPVVAAMPPPPPPPLEESSDGGKYIWS